MEYPLNTLCLTRLTLHLTQCPLSCTSFASFNLKTVSHRSLFLRLYLSPRQEDAREDGGRNSQSAGRKPVTGSPKQYKIKHSLSECDCILCS
jgi:hypothetical protein